MTDTLTTDLTAPEAVERIANSLEYAFGLEHAAATLRALSPIRNDD